MCLADARPKRPSNRLIDEKSPYLRHAGQPILRDQDPWAYIAQAIALARKGIGPASIPAQ